MSIEKKEVRLLVVSNDGDVADCVEFADDPPLGEVGRQGKTVFIKPLLNHEHCATFKRGPADTREEFLRIYAVNKFLTCTRISSDTDLYSHFEGQTRMRMEDVEKILEAATEEK